MSAPVAGSSKSVWTEDSADPARGPEDGRERVEKEVGYEERGAREGEEGEREREKYYIYIYK